MVVVVTVDSVDVATTVVAAVEVVRNVVPTVVGTSSTIVDVAVEVDVATAREVEVLDTTAVEVTWTADVGEVKVCSVETDVVEAVTVCVRRAVVVEGR